MAASLLPNCRIEVREYKLVPNPSRWMQRGERVIIQSPIFDIPESCSRVPAKRHAYGEEQNSVCFLSRNDIDFQYRGITRWVDAHGVAVSDSSPSGHLYFKRGHRFWLMIKPETEASECTVPVINLDTYEEGTINIQQACWFPKIQGPNDELWTLGGDVRKQKLCGSKKFIHWSWIVCQRLDGSISTTKMAEIPTKEAGCQDKKLLSSSEAHCLFEQRYRAMEKPIPPADLPSPPLTPFYASEGTQERSEKSDELLGISSRYPGRHNLWRRIFLIASQNGGAYKCLERSTIHPQNHLPNRDNDNQVAIKRSCPVADNPLSKASSPFTTQIQMPEDSMREAEDHEASLGAQQLLEIYKFDEPPSSREILQITELCDRQDRACKYDTISTSKHFHSPPEKCVLPDSNSNPFVPPHEHCISQHRPLPDRAGGCLLLDRGRGHMCCYWRPEDRNTETSCSTIDERGNKDDNVSAKREWEGRGVYRYGGAVKDQSCLVNVGVGPKNFYVWDHISELGSAGKDLLETLSDSDLNAAAILIKLKELN